MSFLLLLLFLLGCGGVAAFYNVVVVLFVHCSALLGFVHYLCGRDFKIAYFKIN